MAIPQPIKTEANDALFPCELPPARSSTSRVCIDGGFRSEETWTQCLPSVPAGNDKLCSHKSRTLEGGLGMITWQHLFVGANGVGYGS